MRYYKITDIDDGSGQDYASMFENYYNAGDYSFAVFDDNTNTGYFVIRMSDAGTFVFDDATLTTDDYEDDVYDLAYEGNTLTMKQGDYYIQMELVTYDEFKMMNDAYESSGSN